MTEPRAIFVARQPIMNRRHRVVGYRLLFGGSAQGESSGGEADPTARSSVIAEGLADFGVQALVGDALGFVPLEEWQLYSDFVETLPKGRFALEIPRSQCVDSALRERLRDLRKLGFQIAFADFERRDPRRELLEFADYVRVDVGDCKPGEMQKLVRRVQKDSTRLLAAGVETRDQFKKLSAIGVDLFQGYYFAEPVVVEGREIDRDHSVLLELLSRLQLEVELSEIEEEIKKRANLSVGLLRLVNSVGFARSQKIGSLGQALVLIGRRELGRWLNLLLYAGGDAESGSSPLFSLAASRGKTMELLAGEMGAGAGPDSGLPERAFLTGMLSLVHVLLGIPAEQVVEEIQVEDEVRAALIEREGVMGRLLQMKEQVEIGAFDDASVLLDELGLDLPQLNRAQSEAYAWVSDLGPGGPS